MSSDRSRSPARLLAPVALLLFAVAVALIVVGSGSPDEDSGGSAAPTGEKTTTTDRASAPAPRRAPATYTVKPGDTLGKIAQQAGVKVEILQELNPALDPQALVTGQKIKLRE